ncbi:MAG: hypothetical protein ACP5HG_14725 [Anaerolineae bacterium]
MRRRAIEMGSLAILGMILFSACAPRIPAVPPVTLDVESTAVEESLSPLASATVAAPASSTAAPSTTPTTDAASPTPELTTAAEPAPTATAERLVEWPRYANADYSFSFRYPAGWTIELLTNRPPAEGGKPAPNAVLLEKGTLRILVEFKRPEEAASMGPGSLPDGELAELGPAHLLGRELPKYAVVEGDAVKLVFVGERFPDVEFFITMTEDPEASDALGALPDAAQVDFDDILATFARDEATTAADPFPGWQRHSNSETGFAFRYPSEWTLTEIPSGAATEGGPAAAALELRNATYILRIEHKRAGETTVIGSTEAPDGTMSEAGTLSLLDEQVTRYAVVDEGKLKEVVVAYTGDDLEFYISLTEDEEQVAFSDTDIPESIRHMMDPILLSFERVTVQP